MVKPLLEKIKGKIKLFGGDGSYDKTKVYDTLEKQKISPIIPFRKKARIASYGNCKGKTKPRDIAIRYIRKHGGTNWKKEHQYHKRSIIETSMFKYKKILVDRLQSRTYNRQCIEVLLSCKILNKMTACGMPHTKKINNNNKMNKKLFLNFIHATKPIHIIK